MQGIERTVMPYEVIRHPTIFKVGPCEFEVESLGRLTDEQAKKIVLLFVKTHRLPKKARGRRILLRTVFDSGTAEMIEG